MSGRIFQNVVLQFKDTVDTEIGVIDSEGTVIACTELTEIGQKWADIAPIVAAAELGKDIRLEKDFLMKWIDVMEYE